MALVTTSDALVPSSDALCSVRCSATADTSPRSTRLQPQEASALISHFFGSGSGGRTKDTSPSTASLQERKGTGASLVVTGATLLETSALLVVTMFAIRIKIKLN